MQNTPSSLPWKVKPVAASKMSTPLRRSHRRSELSRARLATLLLAFSCAASGEGGVLRGSALLASADEGDVGDNLEGATKGEHRALRIPSLSTETPFSHEWVKLLVSGPMGCSSWRTVGYTWQDADLSTNINNMLETWIYAIAGRQREDVAIIDEQGYFDHISCAKDSNGEAKTGWACVWAPTPHLCYFSAQEGWEAFMRQRGASDPDVSSATAVTFRDVRTASVNHAEDWFRSFGTEEPGAYQILSKLLLWNHLQPWMKKAVREVVIRSPIEVRQNPFIGIYLTASEMDSMSTGSRGGESRVSTERYLSSSRGYLQRLAAGISVEDIRGIWVVTDDPAIVEGIREDAINFFPSASVVVSISEKDVGESLSYGSMVRTLTDLLQLSRSTLFVGPSNSDVTRLVALLRTQLDMAQSSLLSIDV